MKKEWFQLKKALKLHKSANFSLGTKQFRNSDLPLPVQVTGPIRKATEICQLFKVVVWIYGTKPEFILTGSSVLYLTFILNLARGLPSAVAWVANSHSLPDGRGKPISYASHILIKTERKYAQIEEGCSRARQWLEYSVFLQKISHHRCP